MKKTDDLKKAGVTESHAEAIAVALNEVVDNQAAMKEELEKTNETLAAQGKDLAALKTAQEAQGKEQIEQGKALAALTAAQEAQGKALEKTNEALAAQGKEQVEQGKALAATQEAVAATKTAVAETKEVVATKAEVRYLSITFRWGFGILVSAVLLMWFQSYNLQSDLIKILMANTAKISVPEENPAATGTGGTTELDAGAAEKPVAVVAPPPATETGDAAGLDVAEAESPAGAVTAGAAQR